MTLSTSAQRLFPSSLSCHPASFKFIHCFKTTRADSRAGGIEGGVGGGGRKGKDTNIHTLQTVLYLLSELSDIKELLLCLFITLKE